MQFFKKKIFYKMPEPLYYIQKDIFNKNFSTKLNFKLASFGEMNPDKYFYIIRRYPGAGFFSNLIFVLNHLLIAEKHNFIPVVDMENFPTWYNEKNEILGTKNAWEYYFHPVSNYKLSEVYKSKNIIFTSKVYPDEFVKLIYNNEDIIRVFKKHIKIKNYILSEAEDFINNNLNVDQKILGVHLRGGEVRTAPNHAFPPTKKQILYNLNNVLEKENYEQLFLSSKENEHVRLIKNNFKNINVVLSDTFRSEADTFQIYPRTNHRYLMGKEILIEAIVLSKLNGLFFSFSNVSLAALLFMYNRDINKYCILNETNSSNRLLANYSWQLKNILPESLGGFKLNILKKI